MTVYFAFGSDDVLTTVGEEVLGGIIEEFPCVSGAHPLKASNNEADRIKRFFFIMINLLIAILNLC